MARLMRPAYAALLLVSTLAFTALAGCAADQSPPDATAGPGATTATASLTTIVMHTSAGDMTFQLHDDKAPLTVANFAQYVKEGFYSGLPFYRVVPGFVSQAGGESSGKEGSHGPIKNEAAKAGVSNTKYTLAMARTTDPDSATTEFYINAADNTFLDPGGNSAAGYCAFGTMLEGMAVADAINAKPANSVTITSIAITVAGTASRGGAAGSPAPAPSSTAPVPAPRPDGTLSLDAITPGNWSIGGTTDRILAWVHNEGGSTVSGRWNLSLEGGLPLPVGWSATFSRPSFTVSPYGAKSTAGGRPTYPDWSYTLVTLTTPADQAEGTFLLELHAGNATVPLVAKVVPASERATTSGPGSKVEARYDGRFRQNGERFDSGSFPTTLGSGQTVTGFDFGLMGLRVGETQTLQIPPALAYGYDNPPGGSYARFNGQWLSFTVTLDSLA